jgi:hypothetical protein
LKGARAGCVLDPGVIVAWELQSDPARVDRDG